MAILKCPNPSCPYTFDAMSVPPGSVVACPKCGMRFSLGPTAPPPPSYGPLPTGISQPAAPSSSTSGTGLDFNTQASGEATPTSKGRSIARKTAGVTPRRQSYQMIIIVGIAMILLVGAGITVYLRMTSPPKKPDGGSYVKGMNLALDVPPAPWEQDEEMRSALGGGIYLVFKRTDPEAYIAFGGQDFSDRMPRNSELEQGATKVIQKLLESENIEKEYPDGRWLGQKAVRAYRFRGQDRKTGETLQGEAFTLGDRGVGYWTIAWAPETKIDEILPQFESVRSRFRFADAKKIWQPKKSTIVEIKGDKIAYSLQDPDDFWKEDRTQPAADEDPLADIKRVASLKGPRGSDFKLHADLVTFVAESSTEPIDDARAYLDKILNKDSAILGKTELSTVDDEPTGTASPNVVAKNAEVLRLRSRNGNVSKLIVLGAIKTEDKVVFVRCVCPWSEREVFEQNFLAVAGSLRPGR